jgi:hypothetical protein
VYALQRAGQFVDMNGDDRVGTLRSARER